MSSSECIFCMDRCDSVVYLSPVCNCPIKQHLACRRKWDEKYPATCPLCRNVVSAVNTRQNLNARQQTYQSNNLSNVETYVIIEEVVAVNQNPQQNQVTTQQRNNQTTNKNINKFICMVMSGFGFGVGFYLLLKNL